MAAADVTAGVFVGVDSGGTRTNVRLELRSGEGESPVERSYEVAESLSGALPKDQIPGALRKILAQLEVHLGNAHADSRLPVHVWVSAAGYTPWTRDAYLVALTELTPDLVDGRIRTVGAANDAVSLLLGSGADGVIIAGTGSNVIVRDKGGRLFQSGGHEWVACDYGSGFWIGLRGIREAYRDFEAGRSSVLLQRLHESYHVEPDDAWGLVELLRRLAIGDKDMKKEIARFTPAVCAAAERGDKPAQDLVKREAEELADVTAGSLRRRFTPSEREAGLRLVQCGSLLSNVFYRDSFESQLDMRLLSGSEGRASLIWDRRGTGGESAVMLARSLAEEPARHVELDRAFRPVVVELRPETGGGGGGI